MAKVAIKGRIRERKNKNGMVTSYQVILYKGKKPSGKNDELFFKADTMEEAEELLEKKKAEYILHQLTAPCDMTIKYYLRKEWFPNFVENMLKETSKRAYLSHMKYLEASIGNIKLTQLTTMQVQKMYIELSQQSPLSGKPLSYRTILDVHRTLNSALNIAVQVGYIKKNPTIGTKIKGLGSKQEKKKRVYTSEEVHALLEGVKNTDMEMPLTIIIDGTLRRGEALALEFQDIDFEKETIKIDKNWVEDRNNKGVFSSPKTFSSARTIKLTKTSMKLLRKARKDYYERKLADPNFIDSQRVICQPNGKPFLPKSFYHKYKKTIKKLNLPDIRLHDLRHTGITLQLERGAKLKAVSMRAGHSSTKITADIYGHYTQKMEDETVDIIEDIFQNVENG